MVEKLSGLYLKARHALLAYEDAQTAGTVARELLCHITGKSREALVADYETFVGDEVCQALDRALERLAAGEPLAYVLQQWDFYGLRLHVDPNVLIPRDDTCAVTALAIEQALFLGDAPRILDLCTGSGCIGLAVATRVRDARVTLADLSRQALAVARENVKAHKLTGRVSCVQADALQEPAPFLGKFDLIVSNPPYITTGEMASLDRSVRDYEPHMALHGGDDGLDFYRAITCNYRKALKPGGYLCFEFGMGQGDDVCALLENNGYTVLERSRDYNDIERAVIARYDRKED